MVGGGQCRHSKSEERWDRLPEKDPGGCSAGGSGGEHGGESDGQDGFGRGWTDEAWADTDGRGDGVSERVERGESEWDAEQDTSDADDRAVDCPLREELTADPSLECALDWHRPTSVVDRWLSGSDRSSRMGTIVLGEESISCLRCSGPWLRSMPTWRSALISPRVHDGVGDPSLNAQGVRGELRGVVTVFVAWALAIVLVVSGLTSILRGTLA